MLKEGVKAGQLCGLQAALSHLDFDAAEPSEIFLGAVGLGSAEADLIDAHLLQKNRLRSGERGLHFLNIVGLGVRRGDQAHFVG